jgi:hypothetical protein
LTIALKESHKMIYKKMISDLVGAMATDAHSQGLTPDVLVKASDEALLFWTLTLDSLVKPWPESNYYSDSESMFAELG